MRIVEDDLSGAPIAALLRRGFVDGPVFGDYRRSAFNQFLNLDL